MTTHSSVLAWRIPWTEEPGGLHTMEWSQRVVHDRSDLNHAHLEQSLLRPPQLSMRECAPRNVDVRGRKHHPQVVPWLNCACAELSCPPLITSPTPRAPHSTWLYPTVRQPLSFGAAGLRPVLSPHSATLQIPHLSVLQTSASPRFDLLCAHRPAKPGSETCQERRDWVVGGEGRKGETGKEVEKEPRGRECGGETRLG